MVSDGAGGAIITWQDFRGTDLDIYVQHIDAAGVVQWDTNGVLICASSGNQNGPRIVSDGAGGAIIAWDDNRSGIDYDIYARRINAAGVAQWTTNGVPICTAVYNQGYSNVVSDGAGGAIITWLDIRNSIDFDIYAQRINAAGVVQWDTNGVPICIAANDQDLPLTLVSDDAAGAIITWVDYRNDNGSFTNPDIYAQRISGSGAVQWIANGIAICTAASYQFSPTIVRDGAGGAIIAWHDRRIGDFNIYTQRINAMGVVQWTANGVPICTASGVQSYATATSDGAGGAIVAWDDLRSDINYDIYAQRINAAGAMQWTANGVAISMAANLQYAHNIVADSAGGAIIAWEDYRTGTGYPDIYSQRITASGVVQWAQDGVAVSTAAYTQNFLTIISDGAGGAINTWWDSRDGTGYSHIYAQQVSASGNLGEITDVIEGRPLLPSAFRLHQNFPNPFNPSTLIRYQLPLTTQATLKVYNVLGQELATLVNAQMTPGSYEVIWEAPGVPSGIYFYRLQAGSFNETKKLVLLR